jgi:hypothetical protein
MKIKYDPAKANKFKHSQETFSAKQSVSARVMSCFIGLICIIPLCIGLYMALCGPIDSGNYLSRLMDKNEIRTYVKKRLLCPSTAKFEAIKITQNGCFKEAHVTVDAQNKYGAMVRETYRLENRNGRWGQPANLYFDCPSIE